MAKYMTLSSLLFFTRYFFKKQYHRKFVVGMHHMLICEAMERVFRGEITRLIINIAPRYSKTEIVVKNGIAYGLALNPSAKFIHLSYANELAMDNSEGIKEIIKSADYQQLFPHVQIKQKTDSKKKWYTTADGGVYATAAGGQVTGFGAGKVDMEEDEQDRDFEEFLTEIEQKQEFGGALIIDDPIKPEDADSPIVRDKVNKRFDSTIRNRVNSRKTPIIIIMQRLHESDLCGYLQNNEPEDWTIVSLPCVNQDGTALWPFKHTLEELKRMEELNPVVFARQFMQQADSITGKLYKKFKTYRDVPYCPGVKCVIDTADEGSDYLISIVYAPTATAIYLLDVYYTQAGMEVTEPKTAQQQGAYHVTECRVESNAGGRSFARNVERICRENKNWQTSFIWYHQNKNKNSRIFSQAAEVQNMIYYPEDWETRWPIFARAIKSYLSEGGNSHDDAPDALTMIIEAEKLGNYQIL